MAPRPKHSIDVIVALHDAGLRSKEIGARLGTCPTNIRARLRRAGIRCSDWDYSTKRRLDVSTDDVVALYRSGQSARQIAHHFKMTKRAILERLRSRNILMREQSDYAALSGPQHPLWKGGRFLDPQGYVITRIAPGKRRLEHRVVMEKVLGRPLKTREYVHHINGIRDDNRPENLVITHPTKHETRTLITALQRRIRYLEALVAEHQNPRGTASGTTPSA